MKPMDMIFIGAIVVIIGGIVGAIGTRMQNKASSAKSDKQLKKIEELNDKNIVLVSDISKLSSQNADLAKQLGQVSEQNSKLMLELSNARKDVDNVRSEAIDNVFGGMDAYFGISIRGHGKLLNESEKPVYDLAVFVTNYDKLLLCARSFNDKHELQIDGTCYWNATVRYTVGTFHANSERDLEDFIVDINKPNKTLIKFISKKGTYYQQSYNNPTIGTAYRLLILKNGKWEVLKSISNFKNNLNWEEEFPLPVSFNLSGSGMYFKR